jgi:hypothetical protein
MVKSLINVRGASLTILSAHYVYKKDKISKSTLILLFFKIAISVPFNLSLYSYCQGIMLKMVIFVPSEQCFFKVIIFS